MSIQRPLGKVCAGALLLVLSNAGFADSVKDRLYLDADYGQGFIDTESGGDVDLERLAIAVGFKIDTNLFAEAIYSDVEIDNEFDSTALQLNAGYQHRFTRKLAGYTTAGVVHWDSSDFDETDVGYGVGVGIVWGDSQLQFKAGYEYFGSFESDALFDVIHLTSIGVRYNFGRIPPYRKSDLFGRKDSKEGTTACQDRHKHLFFLCDDEDKDKK